MSTKASAPDSPAFDTSFTSRSKLLLSSHPRDAEWLERIRDAFIREVEARLGNSAQNEYFIEHHDAERALSRDDLPYSGGSAVVVLLSESYLASPYANANAELLRRSSVGPNVLVLPVLVSPCNWADTQFGAWEPTEATTKPLAEQTHEQATAEIASLVRMMVDRHPLMHSQTEMPDGPRTLASLQEFSRVEPIDRFLAAAAGLAAHRASRIDADCLLSIIIASGGVEGESQWVGDVLRRTAERPEALALETLGGPVSATQTVDEGLLDAFAAARDIAKRASNSDTIHARHLLMPLIAADDKRTDTRSLLDRLRVDRDRLHKELIDFICFDAAENRAEWERIIRGEPGPDRRLFDFHADSPGDRDLLGIDRDVTAFATLIAARDINPPLSIGLFGDWGSGKSFFMRELRKGIDRLAREAREANQMQCDWPFYKRIVQVEFNAWHYVDGNLWASLVQHILDNLRPAGDKSTSRALQQYLLKKLEFASSTETEAEEAVVAATTAVADTKDDLTRAEAELETKSRELEKLAAEDVTKSFVLKDVAAFANKAMAELRIAPTDSSADEVAKALSGAQAVLQGSSRVLTPLQRSKDRNWRRLTLFLAVGFIPLTIWMVRWFLIRSDVDFSGLRVDITAVGTALVGHLSALTVWLRKQTKWLDERRKEVQEVQTQYDSKVSELLAKHSSHVATLREDMQRQANDLAVAKQKHEEAKQKVAAAKAELDDATSGRLLARFVEDRAGSTDYRKHLGVLAVVRRDFESLSNLIEEENWRLLPKTASDTGEQRPLPKFASLVDEAKDENVRINRIVLYIDDLDRCPPGKVVDVLQAVHLLLAFPLFVVVVGVDARWIARSLETRYRELLHTETPDSGDRFAEVFGRATTNDYLEKIFQVPYWIRPMDEAASAQMIQGLFERSMSADAVGVQATMMAAARSERARSSTEFRATPEVSSPSSRPSSLEGERFLTSLPGDVNAQDVKPADSGDSDSDDDGTTTDRARRQLASLVVHSAEMQLIAKLTPLLGRSPRSLKRFVNVYRLLKAGLTTAEQERFHRGGLSDSWAVLFLLAVDTGAPLAAHPIFDAVSQIAPSQDGNLSHLQSRLNHLLEGARESDGHPADWADDWSRVDKWLSAQTEALTSPAIMDALDAWAPRVARYSFHAIREKIG